MTLRVFLQNARRIKCRIRGERNKLHPVTRRESLWYIRHVLRHPRRLRRATRKNNIRQSDMSAQIAQRHGLTRLIRQRKRRHFRDDWHLDRRSAFLPPGNPEYPDDSDDDDEKTGANELLQFGRWYWC